MLAARGQSHTTGRPTKTARAEGEPDSNVGAAPEAAVHVHLDGIDDVAQHADRAGPQSRWRTPWLDTQTAAAPASAAPPRSA